MRCEKCRHYKAIPVEGSINEYGLCYRYPPVDSHGINIRPTVHWNEPACGEYQDVRAVDEIERYD